LQKLAESWAGRAIRQHFTRREVVAMRNIVLTGGIGELCGGSDLTEAFDVLCFLTTNVRDGVADTCAVDIFIAILLQLAEPDRTLVESLYDPGVFVRVGEERGSRLRIHEQGSELGGGDLEADFRKLLGIVFAEVIGEMILEVSEAKLVLVLGAPFLVTAPSTPIGDITFGDGDAALGKRPDDFGIGNVVVEKFVDHVTCEFRQAGDFAAAAGGGWRVEGRIWGERLQWGGSHGRGGVKGLFAWLLVVTGNGGQTGMQ